MVPAPAVVAAIANAVSGLRAREGIGRVERQVGSDSYLISLGRDKINVTVTSGTLVAGERVNVIAHGRDLVIERLDEAARRPSGARSDSFVPHAVGSPRKLKGSLDTILLSLTQGRSDAVALRQSEALFSSMASACSRIDAGLTATISSLLGTIAGSEEPSSEMIATAVKLIEQLKGKIDVSDPPASTGRVIIDGRALPEGMFAFTSVEEALRFLGKDAAGDPALAARLRTSLNAHGIIILSTRVYAAQESVLLLLGPEDVLRELDSWKGSALQSRMFKSVPADVFARVFADRGALPLDYLRLLDTFAAALQMPAGSSKAGSPDAQAASLVQWLHAAADSRAAPSALAPLAPVFSPASIIDALRDLAAAWSRLPQTTVAIPPPEQFGLVAPALDKTSDRLGLIARMVQRLGLDFEQAIAAKRTPDTAGLKPFLLQLLHLIEPARPLADTALAASSPATQGAAVPPHAAALFAAVQECRQACLTAIDKMTGATPLSAAGAEAQQPLDRPAHDLRQELRAFFASLVGRIERQQNDLLLLIRGSAQAASSGQELSEETAEAFLRDVKERLNAFIRQSIAVLELTIQKHAQQDAAHARSQSPSEPAGPPAFYTTALEKSLLALISRLDLFRPRVISMAEAALREALHENAARAGADGKGGAPAAPADHDASPMVRQTVQANIETLLQRIESLQLMARQTPTASGEQQIISLPVKIGEEWTEMHVRLIKQHRKERRGGGDRQHYTVYINVAPTLLGPICARLDYQVKKSLSIALEIESAPTRAWFKRKRSALRDSLVALGLPSPRIELVGPAARASGAGSVPRAPTSTSIIDVQA
ncbi:MAG: hypothetical protein JW768_02400 [Chitinispirillaceae bacterium]|nr:hypothetical protein [Chitinispirillaceae bacterium]